MYWSMQHQFWGVTLLWRFFMWSSWRCVRNIIANSVRFHHFQWVICICAMSDWMFCLLEGWSKYYPSSGDAGLTFKFPWTYSALISHFCLNLKCVLNVFLAHFRSIRLYWRINYGNVPKLLKVSGIYWKLYMLEMMPLTFLNLPFYHN